MKKLAKSILIGIVIVVLAGSVALISFYKVTLSSSGSAGVSNSLRVYDVNKFVSEFPEKEDFSTPEAAYAAINRVIANGQQGAWRRISIEELRNKLPSSNAEKNEILPEDAKMWLSANILEVRIFKNCYAVVIAELMREGGPPRFDHRAVHLEDDKWLNAGQSTYDSLDKAKMCAKSWAQYVDKPIRNKIDNPESHLKPFVKFLRTKAKDPKTLVLDALAAHKVTIIGETHHRPLYWAFNSSLVTDPSFAKHVATIYLELPSDDQELVDKFLAAKKYDITPIIEVLRDNLWTGWPDQAMLDFFITVWMVNQSLKPEQHLRIVLVDMERPWEEIHKREDWHKYNVDRDQFMANNIVRDLQEHKEEKRNALFVVGVGHAGLNLEFFEGSPLRTAGWYLRQKLGVDNVYAIFQHRCIMSNVGRVEGRLCLGLFDSAFAAIGKKPIAFPLDIGPFGEELFDAFPDRPPMLSTYRDGFDAYLYLGPLEYETFSPLITGFYSDEFVKELARRYRLTFKKGLVEGCGLAKLDTASFINWMSGRGGSWGKPRKWRSKLGPIDAWKYGNIENIQEERHELALEHPKVIRKVAEDFFKKIRTADYDYFLKLKKNSSAYNEFITPEYSVATDYPLWVRWVCSTFKSNPIKSIELGEVFKSKAASIWGGKPGIPVIRYKITLNDGTTLEGTLPFAYHVKQQCWRGELGVDWHLQHKIPAEK